MGDDGYASGEPSSSAILRSERKLKRGARLLQVPPVPGRRSDRLESRCPARAQEHHLRACNDFLPGVAAGPRERWRSRPATRRSPRPAPGAQSQCRPTNHSRSRKRCASIRSVVAWATRDRCSAERSREWMVAGVSRAGVTRSRRGVPALLAARGLWAEFLALSSRIFARASLFSLGGNLGRLCVRVAKVKYLVGVEAGAEIPCPLEPTSAPPHAAPSKDAVESRRLRGPRTATAGRRMPRGWQLFHVASSGFHMSTNAAGGARKTNQDLRCASILS